MKLHITADSRRTQARYPICSNLLVPCLQWQQSVMLLQTFLKEVGSPSSHIDKCNFSNEKNVETLEFSTFEER